MSYLFTLFILLTIYILLILLMKKMKNIKLFNAIFIVFIFITYLTHSLIIGFKAGFNDWNYKNTLPVANVSPFMFSTLPILLILPDKIKKHCYLLISLLTIGMLLSAVFNCVYNFIINYKFHPHFVLDYIAHIALSLFGIYLIKTKQVKITTYNCLISCLIIFSVSLTMLVLNVVFDTSFFGLSLNGKHNIYNIVISNNSYISALVYFLGLGFVLFLGFLYSLLFYKKIWR